MNVSSLLALCLLVCTGPVLGCDWDLSSYPEHGPTFLVLQSVSERSCLETCCNQTNCDLVLVGFPVDRRPPCQLVDCSKDRDMCDIKPSALFKVYRKKGPRPAGRSEAEGGEKLSGAPGTGTGTGTNETNSIRCRQPMKVGVCRAAFPKFYYNVTNQTCRPFIYGGCGGNGNNFNSQDECEDTCSGVTGSVLLDESTAAPQMDLTVIAGRSQDGLSKSEPSAAKSTLHQNTDLTPDEFTDNCMVTSDPGPCRAAFPMFYYDHNTDSCQSFVYGGCRGNQNRYSSVEECMSRCSRGASTDTHGTARDRWTPAIFLFVTLTTISALLLAALVIITLRRHRLPRRPSSVSDKEELLPDPDEQSSLESLTIPESPKLGSA